MKLCITLLMNNDLSLLQTIPLSVLENTNKCGTIYHRIFTLIKSFLCHVEKGTIFDKLEVQK